MKTRLLFLPLLLMLVASLAACGGSQQVPANAVAVVDGTPITLADFNDLLAQAEAQAKAQGQPVPKPGTPQYTQLRGQVVAYLVQLKELEQQAKKENVSVSQDDVTTFLTNLAKQQYAGSMKKLFAAYKKQGFTTMDALRNYEYSILLGQKLYAKITESAKVTPQEEKAFFNSNRAQYPATRSVEHILVKKKSLADDLVRQLKNGASFAKLARKYSKDPGSAAQGGKFTATRGREVPAYDDVAFTLKKGQLSPPIDATSTADGGFGWFIIKALGDVNEPTFSSEQASIHETLLRQAQQTVASQWFADLQKSYKGKVSFQSGYAPPETTAVSTAATG